MSSPGTVGHSVVYAVGWSTEQEGDDFFVNPALEGSVEKIDDVPRYRPSSPFYDSMSSLAALNSEVCTSAAASLGNISNVAASLQTFKWPQLDVTSSAVDALYPALNLKTSDLFPSLGLGSSNIFSGEYSDDAETTPPPEEAQSDEDETEPPQPTTE